MRKEKKIAALTLTLGLTGLVSQALAKTSYYSSSDTDTLLGLSVATILVSVLVSVGIAVVFGLITKHMNESKGYPGGFAWGFFLGIIGIIVVACKTDLRNTYPQNQNNYNSGYNASNTPDRSLQQPANDVADRIRKLADLHAQGIISDAEYEAKKADLLSKM